MKTKKAAALVLAVLTTMMAFAPAALATYAHINWAYWPSIQNGSLGQPVKAAQRFLNRRWYNSPGLTIDGAFGPKTEKAVKKFQQSMNLTQDGIVGTNTWAEMRNCIQSANGNTYDYYKVIQHPDYLPDSYYSFQLTSNNSSSYWRLYTGSEWQSIWI